MGALVRRENTLPVHQPRPMMYRYEDRMFSEMSVMLVEYAFPILKHTKCGVWIEVFWQKRFVNLNSRKRYACPTKQEALASYHARKRRQVGILRHQLKRAEAALTLQRVEDRQYFTS